MAFLEPKTPQPDTAPASQKRKAATENKTGLVLKRIKEKYGAARQERYSLSVVIDTGLARMLAGLTLIATDGDVKASSLPILKDLVPDLLKESLPRADRKALENLPAEKVDSAVKVLFKQKK